MSRVHVLVEGQTEETFVHKVLAPHLQPYGVYLTPIIIATKRVKSGHKFKGGIFDYAPVRRDLRLLLRDRGAAITTMIDYYRFPADFPKLDDTPRPASCYERVKQVEKAFYEDLGSPRNFFPYLSLHEFEALLLVSPTEIGAALRTDLGHRLSIADSVASPEEINDGEDTHPAARILELLPAYRKRLHGPLIATRIGLAAIRERCPHFHGWVTRLEELGQPP